MRVRKQGPRTAPAGPPYGMKKGGAFAPPRFCLLRPCAAALKYGGAVSAHFDTVRAVLEDAHEHVLDATAHAIHRNIRSEVWSLHGLTFRWSDLLTV